MDNNSGVVVKRGDGNQMELPPGFRFHPTDEELITYYLSKKVIDSNFSAIPIEEVDMNKVEPWELPWKAKLGENDWYFFCVRDKKYSTGLRTNRATAAGYWKATGKDKEIYRGKTLVGMKKTLVFYKGRAPRGEKSNWVTHEYRLEGKICLHNHPNTTKNDWVISKVFKKTSGGKKIHISGLMRMNSVVNELNPPTLPPLADSSPYNQIIKPEEPEYSHVHCFSNPIIAPQKNQENMIPCFNNSIFPSTSSNPMDSCRQYPSFHGGVGFQFPGSIQFHDSSVLRAVLGSYTYRKQREVTSASQETAMSTENSSVVSNIEMGILGKGSFEEQEAPAFNNYNFASGLGFYVE